jgi:hypothetical protein
MSKTSAWFYQNYQYVGASLAILAVIATAIAACVAWRFKDPALIFVALFLWAVIPPITFWWEYYFVYLRYGIEDRFELFKYGQQICGAIWAGVLVCLIAIASSDHFKSNDRDGVGGTAALSIKTSY